MVVEFSKKNPNFNKFIITNLIATIPDMEINELAYSQKDYVKVVGDIHKSQWTADNVYDRFWFKLEGYRNGVKIPRLKAVHVYVCAYVNGYCVNPPVKYGTDLPTNSESAFWMFSDISYSF